MVVPTWCGTEPRRRDPELGRQGPLVTAASLRARGDVWVPTFTHLASYIAIMMPLAWWLAIPCGMGILGLVVSIIIASVVSAGLLLARFWMLARRDA